MTVGIGDDAAVVEPERGRLEVLTVDALVEGVHFDRRFTPPAAIGHRALAVNLSDLAAMGAAPRLGLLSLVLPPTLPCSDFDGIADGFAALALRYRMQLAGGNLSRSPGPLMIDVTVAGTVKRRQALTRHTARPGDHVFVTGTIGAAAAGLQMLKNGLQAPGSGLQEALTSLQPPDSSLQACVQHYLYPEPRIRAGLLLSRNRAASACIDLSDGLADGLRRIAEASGIGIVVNAGAVPIEPFAQNWFESSGDDAFSRSISGGDDYELLFTVGPRQRARFRNAARHVEVPLARIGVCTADRGVVVRRVSDGGTADEPLPGGYTHFR
jgi:thiamine-monophosphate kinase